MRSRQMAGAVNVQFVGTGDAFGSGGRLQACIHVSSPATTYLLDCGCSSLIGLNQRGLDIDQIDTVLISHLHGDHFGGLPFLLLNAKYISQRTRPLTLIGPRGLQKQVEAACDVLYPGTFSSGFNFDLEYIEPGTGQKPSHTDMRHGHCGQALGFKIVSSGRTVAYTGDTEWTETLVPLAEDADLLICECFQYDQPSPSHLDYATLMIHRQRLRCDNIILTHAGDAMLRDQGPLELKVAHDGLRLTL